LLKPPNRWPTTVRGEMKSDAQTIIDGVQPHWGTMHGRELSFGWGDSDERGADYVDRSFD
jgi:hypothetical protein